MPSPPPPAGRPTSKDVARHAGVSQSTVSLVLAGKWRGRVSPATVETVRDAAAALGYRPNTSARSLRLGRTRTVMLVVPVLTSPFFGAVHSGAARVAAERDFGVVVYPTLDGADLAPNAFSPAAIDGVLASSMAAEPLDVLRSAGPGTGHLPLVMLDSEPGHGVPTVNHDVAEGMRTIAEYVVGLGHRRVARLRSTVRTWTFEARDAAFRAALGPAEVVAEACAPLTLDGGREAALSLLAAPARPTALLCDDDLQAAGAYKAARALGLRVPDDLSVTGFDDMRYARVVEPELTTFRLPAVELGARGMTALLDLLDTGDAGPDVVLPGELVIRGSTAPPTPA
ncbi:LacI family DNA-binding transcriptional regulator [Embleya hyalina]|uniref:LacI family transcriptional regulator n=1 Tax=Embleya hyalina TaxID=516124 RepID=A0A401YGS3_9ACTN|nr:LacI family DNA-binding transcriptional regulator [Embleya hyalina]GCD93815.1 LacI family transcriptional regulator [Embleya hyalina]